MKTLVVFALSAGPSVLATAIFRGRWEDAFCQNVSMVIEASPGLLVLVEDKIVLSTTSNVCVSGGQPLAQSSMASVACPLSLSEQSRHMRTSRSISPDFYKTSKWAKVIFLARILS